MFGDFTGEFKANSALNEGKWANYKIKKFLEGATTPNPLYTNGQYYSYWLKSFFILLFAARY